jgi:translation initiation factor 1
MKSAKSRQAARQSSAQQSSSQQSSSQQSGTNRATDRVVYSEFSREAPTPATSRPEPPAAQQPLKVQASRKGRKGKTVTIISGFRAEETTLASLCKQLKGQCGAGGTVKTDGQGSEIEIQGDHRQQVAQWLTVQGYPVKISG